MAIDSMLPGLRRATLKDVPALTQLVNEAFAPEIKFRDGPRISEEGMRKHFDKGTFFAIEEAGELIASIYTEAHDDTGYIGMLSVKPAQQGRGIGRKLMEFAERELNRMGCSRVDLLIVDANSHLLDLYAKFGYRQIGTAPYPAETVTKVPVQFIRMQKELV